MAKKEVQKEVLLSERFQKREEQLRMTPEKQERKARKEEQHLNLLKSLGLKPQGNESLANAPKTGLINPFALTEAILETPVEWANPRAMDIMERVLESSYEDLIKSKDSVLLAGQNPNATVREEMGDINLKNATDLDQLRSSLKDAKLNISSVQSRGKSIEVTLNIEEKREKALSSSHISKAIKNLIRPGFNGTRANANSSYLQTREYGAGSPYSPNRFDAPVQGVLGNCYFMAALSSVAWTHPGRLHLDIDLKSQAQNNLDNPFWFYYLYGTSAAVNGKSFSGGWAAVDMELPVIGDYALPTYARSRYWHDGDYWPAYMEKLFAMHRYPSLSIWEAYEKIGEGGQEKQALEELLGDEFSSAYLFLQNMTTATLLNFMAQKTDNVWKTLHPMTLAAFDATMPGIANGHAYSVLGVQHWNNANYVIIRNPWGHSEPSGDGVLTGEYFKPNFMENERFRFGDNDGIFALRIDKVRENFDRLGYAY